MHIISIICCRSVRSNASPMEVDAMKVFSRDAIGRQSMSEKRKGHVDPRTSSFYQQIKIAKGNLFRNLVLQSSFLNNWNQTPLETSRCENKSINQSICFIFDQTNVYNIVVFKKYVKLNNHDMFSWIQ